MTAAHDIRGWFSGRVTEGWFTGPPDVVHDRDEILVVGDLSQPTVEDDAETGSACSARINGFREDTRAHRIKIATEAEHLFDRKVSWGARCGEVERRFTVASVPVMTRLHLDERRALDTLIDSGIARSRSEALAWCVKMVRTRQSEWIEELRTALTEVERVRSEGPAVD
jgi:hypothetical protein